MAVEQAEFIATGAMVRALHHLKEAHGLEMSESIRRAVTLLCLCKDAQKRGMTVGLLDENDDVTNRITGI